MKSLLATVTFICVVLTLVAQPIIEARHQRNLLDHAAFLGGKISNLGSIKRALSPGRFILSLFSSSYDRYWLYGLDFSGTKISDDDIEPVSRIKHVKELNLSGTRITDVGLRHLRNMEFLTKLDLSKTRVTDEAVQYLQTMSVLASLAVGGTVVSYKALEELDSKLQYAHFCEERAIDELKAAGIQVVDPPRSIEGDESHGCWIVQAGREAVDVVVGMNRPITLTTRDVVNLGYLQSLREMRFHTVSVGPEGLASLRPLPKLKDLGIWFVNITDRDLKALAAQTQLESLEIYGCNGITDDGLTHLTALTNLKTLYIGGCKGISTKALTALSRQIPNCKVKGL